MTSAYAYHGQGVLWQAGGWGDQPAVWVEIVGIVAGLQAEREAEQASQRAADAKRRAHA